MEKKMSKMEDIFQHKITSGIIFCLYIFGSLNLKDLTVLLGQSKTSTLRYLKEILESDMIEIDQVKTAKNWGKFYRLTSPIRLILNESSEFDSYISESDDSIIKLSKERKGIEFAETLKNISEMDTIFISFLGNYFKNRDLNSDIIRSIRKLLLCSMNNLYLETEGEQIEFIKIVKKFMLNLQKFSKSKKKDANSSSLHLVYISSIPIGKLKQIYQSDRKN
jgi:hypothetical protein